MPVLQPQLCSMDICSSCALTGRPVSVKWDAAENHKQIADIVASKPDSMCLKDCVHITSRFNVKTDKLF